MKRPPVKRDEPSPRPITFRAAEDLDPFELAQLWSDRNAWPIDGSPGIAAEEFEAVTQRFGVPSL
jgi:hypothetical protein